MIERPGAVVVRAPATSANLGPGFDCLGLALDLWNDVAAAPAEAPSVASTDGSPLADPAENLVLRAANVLFERAGVRPVPLALACTNRIPFGRGLGSSAAAIASGLLVANRYLDCPLELAMLVDLAVRVEGHPDNVVPCLMGGVRAAALGSGTHVVQVHVPLATPLVAALFVPDAAVSTELARRALPPSVPYADALYNVGRASLLVGALASGDLAVLREGTRDRLHQPYRAPLFPAGPRLIEAALEAGALGAFTSGAGPSVLALCEDTRRATAVAGALTLAAAGERVAGTPMVLPITQRGAHVVREE